MIAHLSPIGCPLQTFLSFAANSVQEKAPLMQKIGHLRQQMTEWREKTKQIQQDQNKMHQIVVLIQQDQEEIEKGQKNLTNRQEQIDQKVIQIQQSHKEIGAHTVILDHMWKILFPYTGKIQTNQKQMQLKLQDVEQKRNDIHQHAFVIHQNIPLIHQNLQNANQIMNGIPHQVRRIKQDHQAMKILVKTMEEKRDNIRYHLSGLQPKKVETMPLRESEPALHFSEDQKPVKEASFYFWTSLLKRMKDIGLWILLELGYQIEQAHQRSKNWVASILF